MYWNLENETLILQTYCLMSQDIYDALYILCNTNEKWFQIDFITVSQKSYKSWKLIVMCRMQRNVTEFSQIEKSNWRHGNHYARTLIVDVSFHNPYKSFINLILACTFWKREIVFANKASKVPSRLRFIRLFISISFLFAYFEQTILEVVSSRTVARKTSTKVNASVSKCSEHLPGVIKTVTRCLRKAMIFSWAHLQRYLYGVCSDVTQ